MILRFSNCDALISISNDIKEMLPRYELHVTKVLSCSLQNHSLLNDSRIINIHVLFEGSCKNYPKPNPNLNPNPKPNSKIRKRKKENKKTKTKTKNEDVRDWNCKTPCYQLLLNDYLTNCVKSHSLLSLWGFFFPFYGTTRDCQEVH